MWYLWSRSTDRQDTLSRIFQLVLRLIETSFRRLFERPLTMIPEGSQPSTSPPTTIYALPDEVLVHIFRSTSRSKLSSNFQRTLLSISHVCVRWRQLSLASGELWRFLVITYPLYSYELDRAREWVCRSAPYPLYLIIDVRDPDWDFNEEAHPVRWLQMQAIMGIILPAADRWQDLKVAADNWEPLHAFLHFTQNAHVPILRSIHLNRCNPYFASPGQDFVPSASRVFLPFFGEKEWIKLTSVELDGVHVDWTSPALSGLSRLSFGYHARDVAPSLVQFRDILTSCPELDSLTLNGWGPSFGDGHTRDELSQLRGSIGLPHLRNLELGIMIPTYVVEVLSLLVIPSLESLTLDDITRYDPSALSRPDLGPVFSFLSGETPSIPNFASIQSLSQVTIMNLDPGEIAFRQFLLSTQNLRILQVRNCAATSLHALTPSSIGTPARNLIKLSVEACDITVLIDVISSRRRLGTLENTDVIFHYDANESQPSFSAELRVHLAELDVRLNPILHDDFDRHWRNSETDDSEDLVTAILEERWDVAGSVM